MFLFSLIPPISENQTRDNLFIFRFYLPTEKFSFRLTRGAARFFTVKSNSNNFLFIMKLKTPKKKNQEKSKEIV